MIQLGINDIKLHYWLTIAINWVHLCRIILSIASTVFLFTLIFHSVDRMWRSPKGKTFNFLPENKTLTRLYIAGPIPHIKEKTLDLLYSQPKEQN